MREIGDDDMASGKLRCNWKKRFLNFKINFLIGKGPKIFSKGDTVAPPLAYIIEIVMCVSHVK